uniref:Uncharacterized protein n=1 Tax=Steinernema glaseri TaxID=37863 RepID=A0A1I8A2F0_9BILA
MEDVRGDENVRDRVKPGLIPYGRVTEAEPTSPVYPRQFGNIGGHILSPPTMRYAFVKTLSIIHANSGEIVRRLEFPGVRLSLANKTAATSVISQEKPSAVYRVTSTAWIVITTGLSSTSFKTLHHWQVICLGITLTQTFPCDTLQSGFHPKQEDTWSRREEKKATSEEGLLQKMSGEWMSNRC